MFVDTVRTARLDVFLVDAGNADCIRGQLSRNEHLKFTAKGDLKGLFPSPREIWVKFLNLHSVVMTEIEDEDQLN